jgi:hypothetical protein
MKKLSDEGRSLISTTLDESGNATSVYRFTPLREIQYTDYSSIDR